MRFFHNQKGVSLIETLVAVSIFVIVAVISSNILVSVAQFEKKSEIQDALYEDMRAIMQQLTNEIQNGTIDYDEYYAVCVINNSCDPNQAGYVSSIHYGLYHGVYGSRFYDPGQRADATKAYNPDDLGVECSFENASTGECDVIYSLSADANTGQNPFLGSGLGTDANAFCENNRGACLPAVNDGNSVLVEQLFLLDRTGTKKTILGKKRIRTYTGGADWSIGKVVMDGKDFDQNGLVDTFTCADGYDCDTRDVELSMPQLDVFVDDKAAFADENELSLPRKSDLTRSFYSSSGNLVSSEFVPITPLRSTVQNLQFIIAPTEDPYKGFSEDGVQSHPTVTIILTLGLSSETLKSYPGGTFNPITVQSTVAAGVMNRIDTYPPVSDVRVDGEDGWMTNISPALRQLNLP